MNVTLSCSDIKSIPVGIQILGQQLYIAIILRIINEKWKLLNA